MTGGSNPGSYTYDSNGNTLTTPDLTLTWTGDNRLATTSDGTTTVARGLDAHGRTLSRSDGTVTSAYRYSSDGDTPSWTIDGTTTSRYVPGPAGLSAVDVAGGDVAWLLPAPHGDVWAHTDDTGAITATFAYDEYGVPQAAPTGDLELDRYGWLGQQQRETDPATGLILMGVRAYDPNLGRFLSVDSVHGGSANHYDYVSGDPINHYDLDGNVAVAAAAPLVAIGPVGWAILAVATLAVVAVAFGPALIKKVKKNVSVKKKATKKVAEKMAKAAVKAGQAGCSLEFRPECGNNRRGRHVHVDVYRNGVKIKTIHYPYRR